jgi:hypothetical protein
MDGSDTRIGKADSDTVCVEVSLGQRVRIGGGPLNGLRGTVTQRRPGGRYLVRLDHAVYMEIDKAYLDSGSQGK